MRRKRPSSSETASCPVSFARISARIFGMSGCCCAWTPLVASSAAAAMAQRSDRLVFMLRILSSDSYGETRGFRLQAEGPRTLHTNTRDTASIRDAIGNPHRTKSAAGDEQSRMPRETHAKSGEPLHLADDVLRAGVAPAIDARQFRRALDAEDRAKIRARGCDDLVVREIHRIRVVRAAHERAKQNVAGRRTMLPFRRDPGARGDARA